ncbi:DUF4383 domain-containing protein [Parasphingorhabdus pacifica]
MGSPATPPVAWRTVGSLQGLVLILLAAVGLIMAAGEQRPLARSEAPLLLFDLNPAHAVLLLATGVLSLLSAQWRTSLLWFSVAETTGFVVLFLYGTAESTAGEGRTPLELDAAENFLHAGLALIGFCMLCGVSLMPWLTSQRSARARR